MIAKIAIALLLSTNAAMGFSGKTLPPLPGTAPPAVQEQAPGCKDMETPQEVIACVKSTMEELKQKIEDLPPCVETTMKSLGFCALENLKVCAESCKGITIDVEAFPSSPADVATCSLIQKNFVDPMCANNCCPQCQQEFEDVAECVVNEVLDYTVQDCDFECGGGSRRELSSLRGYKN